MENRIPTKPNRIKLTDDSGNIKYYTMERADEPTVEGTPLNKATLFDSENESRYGCVLPNDALKMLTKEWQVSVSADGWSAEADSEGWYTNQVNVEGMKEVYNPIATLRAISPESVDDEQSAFSAIKQIETFDGYIICRAIDVPDSSINIKLTGV